MNKHINSLVNTSVEDMRSSLRCGESNGTLHIDTLLGALLIVVLRGEKSKENALRQFARKLYPTKEYSSESRYLILGGADNVRVRAPSISLLHLEEGLELALLTGMPTCSKTLIKTLDIEIRKKKKLIEKERKLRLAQKAWE